MSASTPRWTREKMLERQQYWKERTLERQRRHHQHHLEFQAILDSIYKYPSKQAELDGMAEYLEWERQFELAEQASKKNSISPPSEPCRNMPPPKFGDEQSVSVPASVEELRMPLELAEQDEQDFDEEQTVSPAPETDQQANLVPPSVEELGTPLELAEQAVEENPVSPASEPCLNMALPNFAGEQADSVPPSVDQLGTLPAPKIRPCHVPDSATHMTPAKSPADVVPSAVLIMDFRNLQYRRHVKHLVDYTDLASMGGNTNTSVYAYSS